MKALFIDRSFLCLDLLRRHGDGADFDLNRLVEVIGAQGADIHLWGTDLPPFLLELYASAGATVHNMPRKPAKGLVEADMTWQANMLPDHLEELIIVSGSGALVPLVQGLSEGGVKVTIACHSDSMSGRLNRVPGLRTGNLDGSDILLNK